MAKAFVCPNCGVIDKGEGILQERWSEVGLYQYDPETMKIIGEDHESSEYLDVLCQECLEFVEVYERGAEPIYALLVNIIEETDSTIKVAPIGSYWLENPQKLADVLAVSTGKIVKVVAPENAE